MPFQVRQTNQASWATHGPPRKKQRVMANTFKGFKKEFNPMPSNMTLSECPPSWKLKLFQLMISLAWLNKHPEFKNIQPGGEWLVGFAERLERDELHDMDWDHLDKLTMWQNETKMQTLSNAQPAVGPSS